MKLNTPWGTDPDDYWVVDADNNYIGLVCEMGGLDIVQEVIKRVNGIKDE
jgi:hypothetical protein